MIADQKAGAGLNTGARGIGTSAVPIENRTPTLAEVGIDKKLSSRAQKLAAVPEQQFGSMLCEWRKSRRALVSPDVLGAHGGLGAVLGVVGAAGTCGVTLQIGE